MDVNTGVMMCADVLATDGGGDVDEKLVARVMDAVRATSPLVGKAVSSPLHDGEHTTDDRATSSPDGSQGLSRVPEGEIEALEKLARQGHPAMARRVAELLDLDDRPAEARTWWLRAAERGDADAAMYVKYGFHEK